MKKHRRLVTTLSLLAAICIAISVLAAGNTITLDSNKPAQDQIQAFHTWYLQLSPSDQKLWDAAMLEISSKPLVQSFGLTTTPSQTSTQMVWIPKSGSRYHKTSSCSNMKNPVHVTLQTAQSGGYSKCSKCWK